MSECCASAICLDDLGECLPLGDLSYSLSSYVLSVLSKDCIFEPLNN